MPCSTAWITADRLNYEATAALLPACLDTWQEVRNAQRQDANADDVPTAQCIEATCKRGPSLNFSCNVWQDNEPIHTPSCTHK